MVLMILNVSQSSETNLELANMENKASSCMTLWGMEVLAQRICVRMILGPKILYFLKMEVTIGARWRLRKYEQRWKHSNVYTRNGVPFLFMPNPNCFGLRLLIQKILIKVRDGGNHLMFFLKMMAWVLGGLTWRSQSFKYFSRKLMELEVVFIQY